MRKMSSVCDYFVIASGTSTTHTGAVAEHIADMMKDAGQRLWHKEGAREASWVLLDFSDVVAHVFLEETRSFYNLERLWGDAPQARYREPKRRARKPRKAAAQRRPAKKKAKRPPAVRRKKRRKAS